MLFLFCFLYIILFFLIEFYLATVSDLSVDFHSLFQIKELNLDNCRSTAIVGLTDDYVGLESLSLINVGLTSLKGFPKLPNLRKVSMGLN